MKNMIWLDTIPDDCYEPTDRLLNMMNPNDIEVSFYKIKYHQVMGTPKWFLHNIIRNQAIDIDILELIY